MTVDEVLGRLEGVGRSGAGFVARCPAHEDRNPSLSIREGEGGRALLYCHAGCEYRAVIEALGIAPNAPEKTTPAASKPKAENKQKSIEAARRIWDEARDPRGTIVQDYLFRRGRTGLMPAALSADADPAELARAGIGLAIPVSIRFHPRLKDPSGAYLPAMVAALDDLSGEIVGIQRTYLKPDGSGKAEVERNKMALGRLRGCAVHLSAGGPELVICEGIETGLSILQATGLHVWPALGTSNLGSVALPDFVREVIIAADHDEPGLRAARAAAESYQARGYRVRIVSPFKDGADFNDLTER